MDVATVILEYIKALSLPLAIVVVAVLLRREVRAALARLSNAVLPGGIKLNFGYETQALSEDESKKRAISEKRSLEEAPFSAPSPLVRAGELPTDIQLGDEHAFTIQSLALAKLEAVLNVRIEKGILIKRGERSAVFDGLIPGSENALDRIVEVQWTRTVNVRALLDKIPQFQNLLESYEQVTGKRANLLIVLVVPQRVVEVVEHLRPFTKALEETHWRVFIEGYEDINFNVPTIIGRGDR